MSINGDDNRSSLSSKGSNSTTSDDSYNNDHNNQQPTHVFSRRRRSCSKRRLTTQSLHDHHHQLHLLHTNSSSTTTTYKLGHICCSYQHLLIALIIIVAFVQWHNLSIYYSQWTFGLDMMVDAPAGTNVIGSGSIPRQKAELCFVTSVFAPPNQKPDHPPSVTLWRLFYPNQVKFYFFTNRHDMYTPGWTKLEIPIYEMQRQSNSSSSSSSVHNSSDEASISLLTGSVLPRYKRYITYSRYGKFLSWQHAAIQQNCAVVCYIDGYIRPNYRQMDLFRKYAKFLVQKPSDGSSENFNDSIDNPINYGLAQFKHKKGDGILAELGRVLKHEKDIVDNVNATVQWLLTRPNFYWNCTLYENTHFLFDPTNVYFQNASLEFWEHYSLEQDSWRDQPLWCYILDHLQIKPIVIPYELQELMFQYKMRNLGHSHHRYNKDADNDALTTYLENARPEN